MEKFLSFKKILVPVLTSLLFLALNSAQASGLTSDQVRRIQQITTAFENSTTQFQYDYIENLGDGRGYTAGRVGFCSGTGDMLLLIEDYTRRKPNNVLARYLPELRRIDQLPDSQPNSQPNMQKDDVSGLPDFVASWKFAALDADFRAAQDRLVQHLYFSPAMKLAKTYGFKTAIAKGFVYDTIVQHGEGKSSDPDSLVGLLNKTAAIEGGTPRTGIGEISWLKKFMEVRAEDLKHPSNLATQKEWSESVDRVDCYRRILDTGNTNLDGPIHFEVFGGQFVVP